MHSLLRPMFVMFSLAIASQAMGQTPPAPPKIPDRIIYEAFFHRVRFLDDFARQVDAKDAKAAASARARIQSQGRLTDKEMELVRRAAVDCITKVAAADLAAKPLVDAYHARKPGGATAPTLSQLQDLQGKRDRIIADHVEALRRSLGAERFRLLDAFIRSTSSVRPASAKGPVPR